MKYNHKYKPRDYEQELINSTRYNKDEFDGEGVWEMATVLLLILVAAFIIAQVVRVIV